MHSISEIKNKRLHLYYDIYYQYNIYYKYKKSITKTEDLK